MNTLTADVLEMKKPRRSYGTGSITARPNGRFQIQYYDNSGRKRRETVSTLAKAEKLLQKRAAQKDAGTLETADTRVKIDVLATAYKTYSVHSAPKSASWIETVWRIHLEPFFGGKVASRIGSDDFEAYIGYRLGEKASNSTINRELTILKAMFNHGHRADPPKIANVPRFPPKLREPNPRSGFVVDEQYDALQANCKQPWLAALLAIAYTFGFRRGELLPRRTGVGLRVHQVDLKAKTIRLLPGETKSDEGRTVFMTDEVHRLLTPCVKDKKPGDAVFTWKDGRPVKDFRGSWDKLTEAAGLPGLLLHDFRRSAVRNLIRAGVSRDVAKRISGHETDEVFSRYNITDTDDLLVAARKLEEARRKP
jgi:integrase